MSSDISESASDSSGVIVEAVLSGRAALSVTGAALSVTGAALSVTGTALFSTVSLVCLNVHHNLPCRL